MLYLAPRREPAGTIYFARGGEFNGVPHSHRLPWRIFWPCRRMLHEGFLRASAGESSQEETTGDCRNRLFSSLIVEERAKRASRQEQLECLPLGGSFVPQKGSAISPTRSRDEPRQRVLSGPRIFGHPSRPVSVLPATGVIIRCRTASR